MVRAGPNMDAINNFAALGIGSLTLGDVAMALVAVVAGFVAGRLVYRLLNKIIERVAERTVRRAALESITEPALWAFRGFGVWAGLSLLPMPTIESLDLHALLHSIIVALTVGLATWLGVRAVSNFTALWAYRAAGTEGIYDDQLVPIVRKTAKVFIVVTGTVMILQNMNYNVGSLLAGLGIGGAAVAFASKDTVANFFGSIVIFIDRPFLVGDWVEIGDVEGTVEQIDIRVTRIRTFSNSLIIVPNSHMTVNAIQNWSRMRKRRIKLSIGVTYDATPDQMRKAVAAIRKIIEDDPRFDHDFYLVNFHALGESALEIFCYFFTSTTQWAQYMQIRQEFLLSVMDAFSEIGVQFAFPTRTVHLQHEAQPPGAPPAMLRDRPM